MNTLPKLIVVVLDNDITRLIQADSQDTNVIVMNRLLTWLARQYERIIDEYKEKIPSKSKKD